MCAECAECSECVQKQMGLLRDAVLRHVVLRDGEQQTLDFVKGFLRGLPLERVGVWRNKSTITTTTKHHMCWTKGIRHAACQKPLNLFRCPRVFPSTDGLRY